MFSFFITSLFLSKSNKTYIICILLLLLSFYLVNALWFTYENLNELNFFNYSLQLMYRFSSYWSSYENSVFFITLLILVIYIIYSIYTRTHYLDRSNYVINYNWIIIMILLTYLIYSLIDWKVSYQSLFGQDYKTILKDILVLYHPLLTYFCYTYIIIISIYFTSLVLSNTKNDFYFYKNIVIVYCLYTLSLVLGSIWAYLKLNWGGYWFWDPLEVVSLLPWFYLVIIIHTYLFKNRYNTQSTVLLTIGVFIIPMLFFFLKSNYLSSIHSFSLGNSKDNVIIILIILFITISLLYFYFLYTYKITKIKYYNIINKYINTIKIPYFFLIFCTLIILIGIILPLCDSNIQLGKKYYISLITPLCLISFLYIGISIVKHWKNFLFYFFFFYYVTTMILVYQITHSLTASLFYVIISMIIFNIIFNTKKKNLTFNLLSHYYVLTVFILVLLNWIFYVNTDVSMPQNNILEFDSLKVAVLKISNYISKDKYIYNIIFINTNNENTYSILNMVDMSKKEQLLNTLVITNIFQDILIVLVKNFFNKYYIMNIKISCYQQMIFLSILAHIIASFFSINKKNVINYK